MLAFITVSRTTHIPLPQTIDTYAKEQEVVIHGFIAREPDRRPMNTRYTVAADWLRSEDPLQKKRVVEGLVLVTDYHGWPEFAYGDEIFVRGTLRKPKNTEDFHYDNYLSRYGIYSVMTGTKLQKKSRTQGLPLLTHLSAFKERFEKQINRIYPEPHASFLAGLLTGSRYGIPKHILENFTKTGLTHVLAISGYNITIIIAIIGNLLFFLPLRWRFIPAVAAIILFTLFVGAEASVVRAASMGILGLIALHAGRKKDARLAILWTLFFMLVWNPKYLWYDAGFQLSFLAVIGLSEASPILTTLLHRIPHTLGLNESLHMTIGAQLFAMPLAMALFGNVSFVAPLANILVALPIPLAMLFGTLGICVSFLSFFGGQLIAYLGWGFLELVLRIAEFLAGIPFASITTGTFSPIFLIGYYAILITLMTWWKRRLRAHPTTDTRTPSFSHTR